MIEHMMIKTNDREHDGSKYYDREYDRTYDEI